MNDINTDPDDILRELKEKMKISHSTEDEELKRILRASLEALNKSCGKFTFEHVTGKELVLERARYVYNNSLEFFSDNFLTEIINLSIDLMNEAEPEERPEA